jgi:HSP20 family protein
MNLIPWNDERIGLPSLQRQMNRLFEDFFGPELPAATAFFTVPVDVSENAEAVFVRAEIPGLEPKDIDISVTGDYLTIKGERKEEAEKKTRTYHRIERRYGAFSRTVELPCPVRTDKIEALAEKGVLTVTLPKAEEARTRKVEIKVKG